MKSIKIIWHKKKCNNMFHFLMSKDRTKISSLPKYDYKITI